jgi:hypothetical protein
MNKTIEMSEAIHRAHHYDLWKFFLDEHGLSLLDSEIQQIIYEVNKYQSQLSNEFCIKENLEIINLNANSGKAARHVVQLKNEE